MKMINHKMIIFSIMTIWPLLNSNIALGESTNEVQLNAKQEYEQEYSHLVMSLSQSGIDLKNYGELADNIEKKWSIKNKEYYARLMLEICKPLSSGTFKDDRRYELARKYAFSALNFSDDIPLPLELELIGHVTTVATGSSIGNKFPMQRREDVIVRLHAWKRLLNSIDPKWNSNDLPSSTVIPPQSTGRPAGIAPKAIKDMKVRKEYEVAIQQNKEKAEKYNEQYDLRKWLKRFPKKVADYIIQMYSQPPFDTNELKKMLADFPDQEAKNLIIDSVEKNISNSVKN